MYVLPKYFQTNGLKISNFVKEIWSIASDRSKLLAAFVSAAVLSAANKLRRLALCAFIILYMIKSHEYNIIKNSIISNNNIKDTVRFEHGTGDTGKQTNCESLPEELVRVRFGVGSAD